MAFSLVITHESHPSSKGSMCMLHCALLKYACPSHCFLSCSKYQQWRRGIQKKQEFFRNTFCFFSDNMKTLCLAYEQILCGEWRLNKTTANGKKALPRVHDSLLSLSLSLSLSLASSSTHAELTRVSGLHVVNKQKLSLASSSNHAGLTRMSCLAFMLAINKGSLSCF